MDGRYYGVQFQGKVGVLLINAEKVIFRPKLESAVPDGTKPTTRSWRWTAIDRVEVLDAPRAGSNESRGLKLKSKTAGGKGVTIKVPQDIMDDVLQDMNNRLSEDAFGVEGAVLKSTALEHKEVPRRKSTMTDAAPSTSSSSLRRNSMRSSGSGPDRPSGQSLRRTQMKKERTARRASMPSSFGHHGHHPESIPEQTEVGYENSVSQEGFLGKVGHKLKQTRLGGGGGGRMRNGRNNTSAMTKEEEERQKKMLEFTKGPAPRRQVTPELELMELKVKEQLERRRAMQQKTLDKKRQLEFVKSKHAGGGVGGRSRGGSSTSTPQQRAKPRVRPPPASQRRRSKDAATRDLVFDEIIKEEEEEDLTSMTEASSPSHSPKDNFEDEPTATLWNPNAPENKFKMMILQHAASCQHEQGTCPYDPICSDHRNILEHIETCQAKGEECGMPSCRSTRNFLVTMRLMANDNIAADDKSTKEFLVGMGAIAPVPVIDIASGNAESLQNDWDAFSTVSDTTWWEKAAG